MADLEADYRSILNNEFLARKKRNPRFSLRAFAKLLGCDPTYLSKLNSGKLILSVDLAAKFAARLKLDEIQRRNFIISAAEEQKCHALYLIDPDLGECSEDQHDTNIMPKPRKI